MDNNNPSEVRVRSVHSLWGEWALAFGSITLCVLLSGYVIPKSVMPAVVLVIAWILRAYFASANRRTHLVCLRLGRVVSNSLFFTAVIMILCLCFRQIPYLREWFDVEGFNEEIPYITSLIIYPVTTIVTGWSWMHYKRSGYCSRCRQLRGRNAECDLLGTVFGRMARRQIRILFFISLGLSLIVWAYYFFFYINVNLNTPDTFFFFIVPAGAYVISLIYTGAVYSQFISEIREYYDRHTRSSSTRGTELRFIVLRGDRMLVSGDGSPVPGACVDTPAVVSIPFKNEVSVDVARESFARLSGLSEHFSVRPLYHNSIISGLANVWHFAVVVEDVDLPSTWALGEDWVSLDQLDRMLKGGLLCPPLASEISRIYRVTMAWKTYDRQGRRLYPIKNYHPTFRLRDFKDWDVDYSDPVWLTVATENQDRPFFRLRKLVRKVSGPLAI